jgi:hypothetical protein
MGYAATLLGRATNLIPHEPINEPSGLPEPS